MVSDVKGKALMLGPRDRGLVFTTSFNNLNTLAVGERLEIDDMAITGIKATHGELVLKLGPFSKTVKPGPEERVGWGAIGFEIDLDGKTIVNLGDTLLQENEWRSIIEPDVLMAPIGGKPVHNTMDEREAVQAANIMRPKLVISCHYNCPAFFTNTYNPADDQLFKREVEKTGSNTERYYDLVESGCAHGFICRGAAVASGDLAVVGSLGNGRSLGRLCRGNDGLFVAPRPRLAG